jgi:hypothetical protein
MSDSPSHQAADLNALSGASSEHLEISAVLPAAGAASDEHCTAPTASASSSNATDESVRLSPANVRADPRPLLRLFSFCQTHCQNLSIRRLRTCVSAWKMCSSSSMLCNQRIIALVNLILAFADYLSSAYRQVFILFEMCVGFITQILFVDTGGIRRGV